jgi:hypothetical protein
MCSSVRSPDDVVAHPYCPGLDDTRVEAAAVDEGAFGVGLVCERFHVATRFTESHSLENGLADTEPVPDEVVERDPTGGDVPSVRTVREVDVVRFGSRRQRFGLDERDVTGFEVVALVVDAISREVSVPLDAASGDGGYRLPWLGSSAGSGRDVDRLDRADGLEPTDEADVPGPSRRRAGRCRRRGEPRPSSSTGNRSGSSGRAGTVGESSTG